MILGLRTKEVGDVSDIYEDIFLHSVQVGLLDLDEGQEVCSADAWQAFCVGM